MLRMLAAAAIIALSAVAPAEAQVNLDLFPCFKGWTAGSALGDGVVSQMQYRLPSTGLADVTISIDKTISRPELWGRRYNADYMLNLRIPPASQDMITATMVPDKQARIGFSFSSAGSAMAKLNLLSWGVSGTLDKCWP